MLFDPNNPIYQRCAQGIELEGADPDAAKALYESAWQEAQTAAEKFTAAHYLARVQSTVAEKLQWDECALELAMDAEPSVKVASLPSLYLNVGKGYEDLGDKDTAQVHYLAGLEAVQQLEDSGYVQLIRNGLLSGLERVR